MVHPLFIFYGTLVTVRFAETMTTKQNEIFNKMAEEKLDEKESEQETEEEEEEIKEETEEEKEEKKEETEEEEEEKKEETEEEEEEKKEETEEEKKEEENLLPRITGGLMWVLGSLQARQDRIQQMEQTRQTL
jgi:TATA-binding protein-associated factor Taf7